MLAMICLSSLPSGFLLIQDLSLLVDIAPIYLLLLSGSAGEVDDGLSSSRSRRLAGDSAEVALCSGMLALPSVMWAGVPLCPGSAEVALRPGGVVVPTSMLTLDSCEDELGDDVADGLVGVSAARGVEICSTTVDASVGAEVSPRPTGSV